MPLDRGPSLIRCAASFKPSGEADFLEANADSEFCVTLNSAFLDKRFQVLRSFSTFSQIVIAMTILRYMPRR